MWKTTAYADLVADNFIDGTELEGGHISSGIDLYAKVLARILDDVTKRSKLKNILAPDEAVGDIEYVFL